MCQRKKVVHVFCGPRESFCQITKKACELTMRKKGIPEVLVRSVMSLHDGVKRSLSDSDLTEEFEVKMGRHQGSVLSPFLYAVVEDKS